eukprot:1402344-Amphidinium_carterae.1
MAQKAAIVHRHSALWTSSSVRQPLRKELLIGLVRKSIKSDAQGQNGQKLIPCDVYTCEDKGPSIKWEIL